MSAIYQLIKQMRDCGLTNEQPDDYIGVIKINDHKSAFAAGDDDVGYIVNTFCIKNGFGDNCIVCDDLQSAQQALAQIYSESVIQEMINGRFSN